MKSKYCYKNTALNIAIRRENIEMVKLLLSNQAIDVNLKDEYIVLKIQIIL